MLSATALSTWLVLAMYSHEEADTCVVVHARRAAEADSKSTMVTVSDDGFVIAIGVLHVLKEFGLQESWVAFGQ